MARGRTWSAVAATIVALTACSPGHATSGGGTSSAGTASTRLTVLAAASLTTVFPEIADAFTASNPRVTVRFEFAGTQDLVTQIEQGSPGDVFAGASTKYGDQLSSQNLIATPVPFATNALVVAVPAGNPADIRSPADLARPGVRIVIGAEAVPVGAYTRAVLANLDGVYGRGYSSAVLANVVSEEDNVRTVLSKVELGEADAAFVYRTDARTAGSQVTTVELPAAAQAVATYPISTVEASQHPTAARSFVDFVLSPQAQTMLVAAGFGPPPSV